MRRDVMDVRKTKNRDKVFLGHLTIILFLVLSVSFVTVGLWCIDISVSAMVLKANGVEDIVVTNGWWIRDPVKQYHIGLWMAEVSSLVLACLVAICLAWLCKK